MTSSTAMSPVYDEPTVPKIKGYLLYLEYVEQLLYFSNLRV